MDCSDKRKILTRILTRFGACSIMSRSVTMSLMRYDTRSQTLVTQLQEQAVARLDFRKRHPYTPYRDPQGFIYVDDYKRNRSIRSDELYKFSDDTLTRLLSSLEDITKNINMEYCEEKMGSHGNEKELHF
ncbi:hypothetical protein Tco_0352822 [Tanacetum coccineum]